MKQFSLMITLFAILFSCSGKIDKVNTISLEEAKELPITKEVNGVQYKRVLLKSTPSVVTYLPDDIQAISASPLSNTTTSHLFRKDQNTTLSLTILPMNNRSDAELYLKELLEYRAKNITLKENGFYSGESKGTFQQAKLIREGNNFYIWIVDVLEFQKPEFLPIVDQIVNNTQFLKLRPDEGSSIQTTIPDIPSSKPLPEQPEL